MAQRPSATELKVGTAHGTHAMVATGHALATDAAIAVLREGGNAADAAVCAALVLAVVAPYACTLGGDLFALVYEPPIGIVGGLNATGASPAAAVAERFAGGLPRNGVLSATVPGMLRGLEDLHVRYGSGDFARLLEPAIDLAERGFTVHAQLAANTRDQADLLRRDPTARALFLPGDEPLAEGTTFVQPDYARVLHAIHDEGVEAFYGGALAHEIARACESVGGLVAAGDLAAHESLWQTPIVAEFYGHDVWTMPPNSYGPTLLLQLLELEREGVHAIDPDSLDFITLGFAARKRAYAQAAPWIADPRTGELPARAFFAERYAPGRSLPAPPEARDRCTTNVIVVDEDGLAISLIESVSAPYGAGVVLPGTGILLNNRMAGFRDDPAHPNGVAPRKRPANTLAPAMITNRDRFVMSLGTPGTVGQTCTLAQVLARHLACKQELPAAAAVPRWSVDFQGRLVVEDTMDETLRTLVLAEVPEARTMRSGWISFGSIKAVTVDGDGLLGIADYRRVATTAGW